MLDILMKPLIFLLVFLGFAICEVYFPAKNTTLAESTKLKKSTRLKKSAKLKKNNRLKKSTKLTKSAILVKNNKIFHRRRWQNNILIGILGVLVIAVLPFSLVVWAEYIAIQQWGLLNQISLPSVFAIILAVVVMDFCIYLQHRASHYFPLLWRLHCVHHMDIALDVSTSVRFHPLEILLSMFFKIFVIAILGCSVWAVAVFEMLLSTCAIFTHANITLGPSWDRRIRHGFVTPDMHKVHHSKKRDESNSNYGFCLSCWDRWLGSYTPHVDDLSIGLEDYPDENTVRLWQNLKAPFNRKEPARTGR